MKPEHQEIINQIVRYHEITFESAWASEILVREPIVRVRLMEIRLGDSTIFQLQKIADLKRDDSWMR